jgi:hypothetical protein
MRRSGDVEGVRQSSGNWQRGSNITWCKRTIVRNLDEAMLRNMRQRLWVGVEPHWNVALVFSFIFCPLHSLHCQCRLHYACVTGWHSDHWRWKHIDGSSGGVPLLRSSQSLHSQWDVMRVLAPGGSIAVVVSAHNTHIGLELHVASSIWPANSRQV